MEKLVRCLHLRGIRRAVFLWLVNYVFAGTSPKYFEIKRRLLNSIGFSIETGTKIVGPIECTGTLSIGRNCWIGKNLVVNGNGSVYIGDNCDIAPEVTFQTGGHEIGDIRRRAGKGIVSTQWVGNGVWIGGRSTIIGSIKIGESSVVAACACVVKDVEPNTVVGGVPAKVIRRLEDETSYSAEGESR